MKFEELRQAMIAAMKAHDKPRKEAISSLIEAIKKVAIDEGHRDEIPDEFAPQLMSEEEIRQVLTEKYADVIATKNKGMIMKTVMAEFKGKADGKLISKVVAELCSNS